MPTPRSSQPTLRSRWVRRLAVAGLLVVGLAVLSPATAWAHLEPDPESATPGTAVTINFVVEHGCKASPTTELEMQLPKGITDVSIPAKPGWQTKLTNETAVWTGGPLPSAQEEPFALAFTTPRETGDLQFKVIQTCEEGELAWIQEQQPGGEEPELPIPTLKVEGEAPPTTAPSSTSSTTTEAATTTSADTPDKTTTTVTTIPITSVDTAGNDNRRATVIMGALATAIVIGLVTHGVVTYRRSRNSE